MAESGANTKSGVSYYKFPDILLRRPRCFIALSGLDVINNAIHRLVWDEFSSGAKRTDRKPILFKHFPANHLYPKCGINRSTYEDYSLQGILKTSWLYKHCEELPALVAFFFDLDWNDPQWDEKQMECVSKVEVIRSALQNRATEIVIVLLQSCPPLPVGEASNINSERAAALCTACELPRLNLFVLPFTQRPQGFISKIEEALYKKSLFYYSNKIHTTKAHRDMVANKQLLQLLLIRHNFKIAFFAEMKQEPANALKLYRAAYAHLLENMYLSDDRIMEFKAVAGFINYKLCRLCFNSDEPLDAINQFKRHIEIFSNEVGLKQLAYEHYEWLSRQFSAFADLFSEAVQRGLKGIQTQNPGLYYHQAALYAIRRKSLANQLNLELKNTEILPSLPHVLYYGQRPWRKSLTDDKPSNMELRQRCIVTMQSQEKAIEHSWQIIPLLTQAITHLKMYGCDRMVTFLKVLTVDEYYQVKDYEKSYVLLNGVLEVYRAEQWWENLTAVLFKVLRYSYLLGFMEEYIAVGLELISRYFNIPIEEKKRIQTNISELYSNKIPFPELGLSSDDIQHANVRWTEMWQKPSHKPLTIQVSPLASCVECKTVFTKRSFRADETVEVKVYLRSSAPVEQNLSQLAILFTNEGYNTFCVHDDTFVLEPNIVKTFTFSFPAHPSSVGSDIEISSVKVKLDYDHQLSPTLVWSDGASEEFISQPLDLAWQKIDLRNSTVIQSRSPCISISLDHSNPALSEEYYDVTVHVVNQELTSITNISISLSLPVVDGSQPLVDMFESVPATSGAPEKRNFLELTCPQLESNGGKFSKKFFLTSHGIGTRHIDVLVHYEISCCINEKWESICHCQKSLREAVSVVKPFDMIYKLMTTRFKVTESITFSNPFILMTELNCTSPWQLHIAESIFQPSSGIQFVGENFSQVEGLEMNPKDKATECYCLEVKNKPLSSVPLGSYIIKWRRSSSADSQTLMSTVTFPPITVKHQAYTLSADIPAYGCFLEAVPISYTVHNKSALVLEFEAKMGASEAFMYSGNRVNKFRILPSAKHTFAFNLLPVLTGVVSLPNMEITSQQDNEKGVTPSLNNSLPTSILIKPSPINMNVDLNMSHVVS